MQKGLSGFHKGCKAARLKMAEPSLLEPNPDHLKLGSHTHHQRYKRFPRSNLREFLRRFLSMAFFLRLRIVEGFS